MEQPEGAVRAGMEASGHARWLERLLPRIWVPNADNRDLRQLLWHRYRMVQARTRTVNQLLSDAVAEGGAAMMVHPVWTCLGGDAQVGAILFSIAA